ncbi:hypothetical protein KsCSTR_30130 [Candidatus Kuenenia stuttgartiensis]|uniref:Uncharacterized protein n=2 Tax=Candidatus Kuenenia TaxID=380738 RepID=A0A2C9CL53_KUEST|nr:hypothetical protein KsCSTR_30130 [Candidatus Kuenenia stuttgartiensis]SOH06303.1 hypothetical protein KSMBR1_3830 [Candidatus Kuenenia stuttgartiensis]
MKEGIANIENVWVRFKSNLFNYLKNLESE